MSATKYNQPKFNPDHPFKRGIRSIIDKHFHPSIAKNFDLIFEVEKYNFDKNKNLLKQIDNSNLGCEIYYDEGGVLVYITDVWSYWSKPQTEYAILKFVTDKYKSGQIGKNWNEKDGVVSASKEFTSAKFETPDSEITKYMAHNARKKGGKK